MQHPMVQTLSIAMLNRIPKDDFVAAISPVFEELDDPWIAERSWAATPFRDTEALHRAMIAAIDRACADDQIELLARQPSIKERKNGLYYRRFSPEQQDMLDAKGKAYQEKFGYPYLCFCKVSSPKEILTNMTRRFNNPPQLERITALSELAKIARERLDTLVVQADPIPANALDNQPPAAANQ
ncbi:MAG: 2-oxo-4-hydroxy-4-carboxy-5-ureidoimidazoline decarboxylase [Pseudomonadota bacterium]